MSHGSVFPSLLENCSYNEFLSFQKCLDTLDNWKVFVKSLDIIGHHLSLQEINLIEIEATKSGGSPAKYIWLKLQSWLVTTQQLIILLRHCQLFDPLFTLVGPEPLEISTQPGQDEEDKFLNFGSKLLLTCEARGLPTPRYQWFHNNQALPNENDSELIKYNLNCEDSGAYYCQVSHTLSDSREAQILSHYINVFVKPPIPQITSQSSTLHAVQAGSCLMLRVFSLPSPEELCINWYHKNKLLIDEHSSILLIENISLSHAGHYLCELSNPSGKVFSQDMNVIVLASNTPGQDTETNDSTNRASCKLALLIANDNYDFMQNLQTPCKDIAEIGSILESLDFVVFAVSNLTRDEMLACIDQFCHMVPPKAYIFFYYVGHGFLMNDKYFMPIDCAENDFLRSHCVCDKQVMKSLLQTDPQLVVFVLDMCLVRPERDINPKIYLEEVVYSEDCRLNSSASIFEAFATRSQSYERLDQPLGIYANHLVKFLADRNLSVSKIFLDAHADLVTHNLETNQRPLVCVDAASNFKLSDAFLSAIHKKVLDLFSVYNTIKKSSLEMDLNPHEKFTVDITAHHCFLNVLSVTFHTSLPLVCSVTNQGVAIEWTSKDNGQQNLLIRSLQRVKGKLELHIKPDPSISPSANVCLSLGRPLIIRSLRRPYTHSKWKNYQTASKALSKN